MQVCGPDSKVCVFSAAPSAGGQGVSPMAGSRSGMVDDVSSAGTVEVTPGGVDRVVAAAAGHDGPDEGAAEQDHHEDPEVAGGAVALRASRRGVLLRSGG